jgi:membrane protein
VVIPKAISTVWVWIRQTVVDFIDDGCATQAAAITFYALLSMAPLLVVVIAIAGAVWGAEAARGEIVGQFGHLMGDDAAKAIQDIIERAGKQQSRGLLATVFGIALLLLGALGVFGQIKSALNTVWEVKPRPGRGIVGVIRDRILSFAMVFCVAFLLIVSLAVSALLSALGGWLEQRIDMAPILMAALNGCISLMVIAFLFAAIYKLLPDARIAWRDVWVGAVATSALFNVGKFAIGLYLGHSSTISVYGAAGSLALILLWVYYSSLIFLFGAEFTQVQARWRGSQIAPAKYAQRVK